MPGLSKEVQQKLKQHQPQTLGQASRIQGITPAAISLLLVPESGAKYGAEGRTEREEERMTREQQLAEGMKALGIDLPADVQERLLTYAAFLEKWNRTYSLTACVTRSWRSATICSIRWRSCLM